MLAYPNRSGSLDENLEQTQGYDPSFPHVAEKIRPADVAAAIISNVKALDEPAKNIGRGNGAQQIREEVQPHEIHSRSYS
jgi:hypothetical protein